MVKAEKPKQSVETKAGATKRRLALQFLGGVLLLMAVLGISGKFLKEPIIGFSRWFVDTVGGSGIALGFFVPDTFPLPIWHDGFLAAGYLGGLGFWEMVTWATFGSLSGGTLAYFLARKVSHTNWFKSFMQRRGKDAKDLVNRYGLAGLAITAVSPVPYSVGAWTAGAFGIPFGKFFAVSLLRFPRVIAYLLLVKLGIVSFF